MKDVPIDQVRSFLKQIEAEIDVSGLENLAARSSRLVDLLIDRLKDIDTICETFTTVLEQLETIPDPDDVDQAELIRMRDRGNSRELRFVAGYLLRLTYEVRYPNKEGS